MVEPLHDSHLVFHLLIQNTIFNKMPFFQLLGRIGPSIIFRRDHVHNSKGTFANLPHLVILAGASPFGIPIHLRPHSRRSHLVALLLLLLLPSSSGQGLTGRSEQINTSGTNTNSTSRILLRRHSPLHRQAMASKVLGDFILVSQLIILITSRDAHAKRQIADFIMQKDVDDGARAKDPAGTRILRTAAGSLAARKKLVIDKGAIGRLVLNHDVAKVVDVDAEMDVADAAQRIIDKDDVAAAWVAAKGKAGSRVLDQVGQTQDKGIVAVAGQVRLEAARVVLDIVVRLDVVGLGAAEDVGACLLGEVLDLPAGRFGVRV